MLSDFTEKELLAELKRRSDRQSAGDLNELEEHDFSQLVKTIRDGTCQSIKAGYEDDDFKHYVYEAAMEAVYGKQYWPWRNAQGW